MLTMARVSLAVLVACFAEDSLMQFEKSNEMDLVHSQAFIRSRTSGMQKSSQDMENEYKALLKHVVDSGSWADPVTGSPFVPNASYLTPIETVVREMEEELEGQKDFNTEIMGNHTSDIIQCNSDRDALLRGTVTTLKGEMKEARITHSQCRVAENRTITTMENHCTAFDDVKKCVLGKDYAWFAAIEENPEKGGTDTLKDTIQLANQCRTGIRSTSDKAQECDGDQDDFKSKYCLYQSTLTETCSNHTTCFNTATGNWNLAESSIKKLEEEQKSIYRMLRRIRCYLKLLMGASDGSIPPAQLDLDKCAAVERITDAPLDVSYGSKAEVGKCMGDSAEEYNDLVKDELVIDSPGDESWYNREFVNKGMDTHTKLQENLECSD